MKENLKKLENYVAEDKIKKALKELKKIANKDEMVKTIILLSGGYRELEVEITRGTLERDIIKLEKNKTRLAILNLIDDLKAQEKGDQEFIFDDKQKKISFKSNSYTKTKTFETKVNPELLNKPNPDNYFLESTILKFLSYFNRWYFSPLRIRKFGGRQKGFEELKNYSTSEITKILLQLLKDKKIKTTTSKKGNPIYKIK